MKKLAFIPAILGLALIFSSCGLSCNGCSSKKYVEIEEVEWIEEEVIADPGPKGGPGETVKVRRPVVKIVRKAVRCRQPACNDLEFTCVWLATWLLLVYKQ